MEWWFVRSRPVPTLRSANGLAQILAASETESDLVLILPAVAGDVRVGDVNAISPLAAHGVLNPVAPIAAAYNGNADRDQPAGVQRENVVPRTSTSSCR